METTRLPPPSGNPPPYAFVGRVYRSSLRPVVLVLALMSGIWTLVWSIGLFKEIHVDKDNGDTKLANFAIALGVMYMVCVVVEAFGITAAILQRIALIRFYSYLSVISTVLVVTCGLMRVIVHFMLKNDLISECTSEATGQDVDFRWGIWGPHLKEQLTSDEANQWCNDAWKHDSWAEIISLLLEILFMALFTSMVFSYYHQMLDPTSAANSSRTPLNDARTGVYPAHYNKPYNSSNPSMPHLGYDEPFKPYGAHDEYAPPPGPPPSAPPYHADDEDAKLPGYGVGAGSSMFKGDDKKDDDPFADFEESDMKVPGHRQ